MWKPADKYALPSAEDFLNATVAINTVKIEIEDTILLIKKAQLRLDTLKEDLYEREAWLAPVRRLTFDTLAIIFNMCAEEDWMSPMRVASVCRIWHDAVVSTHRAWTFIDLRDVRALGFLSLFLKRSGRHTHHVGLPIFATDEYYTAVVRMADRIQCLTIPSIAPVVGEKQYPLLKRLYIANGVSGDELTNLTTSYFPLLRDLTFVTRLFYGSAPSELPGDFPRLETLRLKLSHGPTFYHIVKRCGEGLVALSLDIHDGAEFSEVAPIVLPKLEGLSLFDSRTGGVATTPRLVTPSLKSFSVGIDDADEIIEFPLQENLKRAAGVRISGARMPPVSRLRGARILQLEVTTANFILLLENLSRDTSLCSNLEIIEFLYPARLGNKRLLVDDMISKLNRDRDRGILFLFCGKWGEELSVIRANSCGHRMPCST